MLHQLEKRLGYQFQNISMLELALTHKSVAYEKPKAGESEAKVKPSLLGRFTMALPSFLRPVAKLRGETAFQGNNTAEPVRGEDSFHNERLEFLGDAVLELIVSSFLYETFPEYTEGQLSKLRAVVVSRTILALCAKELGLGKYIIFGAGEAATGGSEKESNLADALEAVIASIYLDGGFQCARRFVLKILSDKIQQLAQDEIKYDYKSALQKRWQANKGQTPTYSVIAASGPAHEKIFEVEVTLSGMPCGRGIGRSKKEAEQQAAKVALDGLGKQECR